PRQTEEDVKVGFTANGFTVSVEHAVSALILNDVLQEHDTLACFLEGRTRDRVEVSEPQQFGSQLANLRDVEALRRSNPLVGDRLRFIAVIFLPPDVVIDEFGELTN